MVYCDVCRLISRRPFLPRIHPSPSFASRKGVVNKPLTVVFNDRAQAVDVLAEVHFASVQVHRQVGVQMEHGKAAKVRSMLSSAAVWV